MRSTPVLDGHETAALDVATAPAAASAGFAHSRRAFFREVLAGAAAIATAGQTLNSTVSARTALSPDAAVQQLIDGNARFAEGRITSFEEDLSILKAKTAEKQEPFAAVLSCADSRVPVELIFDQSIGHVFVTRVAGNIATSAIIASLEYGAAVLGTRAIMVLGHANCGAVKASIEAKAVPGQISTLYPIFGRLLTWPGPIWRRRSKPMQKCRPRCCASLRPCLPNTSSRTS